eukprot:5048909-Alexandrium_andersonii.AAC.1
MPEEGLLHGRDKGGKIGMHQASHVHMHRVAGLAADPRTRPDVRASMARTLFLTRACWHAGGTGN